MILRILKKYEKNIYCMLIFEAFIFIKNIKINKIAKKNETKNW